MACRRALLATGEPGRSPIASLRREAKRERAAHQVTVKDLSRVDATQLNRPR